MPVIAVSLVKPEASQDSNSSNDHPSLHDVLEFRHGWSSNFSI